MGKKRFIEKLKDDDYGEQIREYSIKGIDKCYGEYFKNKAKLKTPTIETLAESVKELQQRFYVAEKKIAEMENHLFPEPADFRIRPEWCVKKENLLELKADVDKAIKLLNKIRERMGEDELY